MKTTRTLTRTQEASWVKLHSVKLAQQDSAHTFDSRCPMRFPRADGFLYCITLRFGEFALYRGVQMCTPRLSWHECRCHVPKRTRRNEERERMRWSDKKKDRGRVREREPRLWDTCIRSIHIVHRLRRVRVYVHYKRDTRKCIHTHTQNHSCFLFRVLVCVLLNIFYTKLRACVQIEWYISARSLAVAYTSLSGSVCDMFVWVIDFEIQRWSCRSPLSTIRIWRLSLSTRRV